jgi:histidinol-phosphate/aromatic aminotransferase/cobyric acid decarboxylase-like protein
MQSKSVSGGVQSDLFPTTSHSPSIAELVGYERAGDIVDFCFIANPYFPTPEMIQELQRQLPALIKHYPSSCQATAAIALAEMLEVDHRDLIVGNGATELIVLANDVLVDGIGVPVPTFGEYVEKLRDPAKAQLYPLRPDLDYQLDLGEYRAWGQRNNLGALLVINPGNPTGQLHSLDEMVEFLDAARDRDLIVVDESFLDFAGDRGSSVMPIAARYPNLLVIQSLSKHYGVPGLRLGFGYSRNRAMLDSLRQLLPTWNLNVMAEYFLELLPENRTAYQRSLERVARDVSVLRQELNGIPGLFAYPTGANFVLVRIENGMTAAELQAQLLDGHLMYVRDCSNKVGMDSHHIRVASQGREADAGLIRALQILLRSGPERPV